MAAVHETCGVVAQFVFLLFCLEDDGFVDAAVVVVWTARLCGDISVGMFVDFRGGEL